MNYSLFLARRLALASGGRKSSPAVRVATIAVALSVVVMTASIAIVLGFKREIIQKLEGFNSDITISISADDKSAAAVGDDSYLLRLTPSLRDILLSNPDIEDFSLQVAAPAILKTPEDFKGVYFKSLSGLHLQRLLENSLECGDMPEFVSNPRLEEVDSVANQILLSRIAADRLDLEAGDKIDVYFISDNVRVRRMTVKGVFNSHFDSYDDVYVFGSPSLLRRLNGLDSLQATRIAVLTREGVDVDEAAASLQASLVMAYEDGLVYRPYLVESIRSSGGSFFQWLELLDINVVVILTLMTFVACMTLVSGMLIIILDKRRFIALMKALGTPGAKLRKVFIYMAVRVALVGLIVGDVVSLALLWVQDKWHVVPLDADSYYIDFVPVEFSWAAFAMLNAGVLLIAYVVLILPSRFIATISPSEVLASEG